MRKPRLRALVLSAGYGTRLRPLTLLLPKPLLPVCGEPVAGTTIRSLRAVGCEVAVLNTHYLHGQIPAALGASYFGLPLRYSHEPEIQGTFGALFAPRDLLSRCDAVIVVNGDSLCRWPLKAMIRRHFGTGADATLLLHREPPQDALGGGIAVDGNRRVVQLRDYPGRGEVHRRHLFAGVQILSPRLLERIENRPGDVISDLYQPLLEEGGRISSVVTAERWHDLGTPGRYLTACLDWARGRLPLRFWNGDVCSPLATVDSTATVRRSIVEQEARVGERATIQESLVMPGAVVGKGCTVRSGIVGPGVVLPASSSVEGRMISRFDKAHKLGPGESVMGELVYTPLGS